MLHKDLSPCHIGIQRQVLIKQLRKENKNETGYVVSCGKPVYPVFLSGNQDGKVSIKLRRSAGDTLSMTRQEARILSMAMGTVMEL